MFMICAFYYSKTNIISDLETNRYRLFKQRGVLVAILISRRGCISYLS